MPYSDLAIDELIAYRPEVEHPEDFDAFWQSTLAESRATGGAVSSSPAATPITEFAIDDVVFPGFAGDPVRAWLTRPPGDAPRPVVVEFLGYGGGRGIPGERLLWAAAGYAHVLMDTRGQGGNWGTGGATPDPHGNGSSSTGWLTRGIEDPHAHFYRRVFTDAVRLIDALPQLPGVDTSRIAVTGGSQGGAISLAAAALSPSVRAVMPDVPFLCHMRRSVEKTPHDPFPEVVRYLSVHRDRVEQTFRTLSYFDGVNFARRISQPALFSVALMDEIVLPSSVYAAYNHLASADREIEAYAFNGHEGGTTAQWVRQVDWLRSRI